MGWKELEYHGATTHGIQRPEYQIWAAMKQRCLNPKCLKYPRYGGRGITMDPRWVDSFQTFLKDVGKRPSPKHSIERKDNDKGYFPGNVKWATGKEQARNTSRNRYVTFRGRRLVLAHAAELAGIDRKRAQDRLESGYSQKEAFERPVERGFLYFKIDGVQHSLAVWCQLKGKSYDTVYSRMKKMGWTVEEALNEPVRKRRSP